MAHYQAETLGRVKTEVDYPVIATSDATTTHTVAYNETAFSWTLVEAYVISTAAYTGADTNFRSVEVLTPTGEAASWDGDSGNDLTANTRQALTLSGTAANLVLATGTTARVTFTENGTGLGLGPGKVVCIWEVGS